MLKILVKAVFFILSGVANIILTPILSIITTIIPDITPAVNSIVTFISTGLTFIPFLLKLLGVPLEAVSFYFSYLILIFGISLSIKAIIFIKNIYIQFKP